MASFQLYDPRTKAFRAVSTTSDADLPFDQVLLINILIELRVISKFMNNDLDPATEDVEEIRSNVVNEL